MAGVQEIWLHISVMVISSQEELKIFLLIVGVARNLI